MCPLVLGVMLALAGCSAGQAEVEICDDRQDNDGDGRIDCSDEDCTDAAACARREICNDLRDNDGDLLVDCDDLDCVGDPACSPDPEICNDRLDNDRDGKTDCADADCEEHSYCLLGDEHCYDGLDNDQDGLTDCDDHDDCDLDPACVELDCANHRDDDGDGQTDCADSDCEGDPACFGEVCDNGADDDEDLLTDCDDPDCERDPACFELDCGDGLDGDGDGQTDCEDEDCESDPACIEEICDNGGDDDGDLLADCDDPDCARDPACFELGCDDGIDGDGDGQTDCDDPDCARDPACFELDCDDGIDGDGDGQTDCEDVDCEGDPACPDHEIDCDDDLDDDGDGQTDCDDPDCDADPHCTGCQADVHEPDGDSASASALVAGSDQVHSICPAADEDWWWIELAERNDLVASTSGAAGDTRLWLYDAALAQLAFDDDGGTGSFSRVQVDGLAAGLYYLRADGNGQEIESYLVSLQITAAPVEICDNGSDDDGDTLADCEDPDCDAFPACQCEDDALEDNDEQAQATVADQNASLTGLVSAWPDHDWFEIFVFPGGLLSIDALFADAEGDIDLYLRDESGVLLDSSTSISDDERVSWTADRTGPVFLDVDPYTQDMCNGYELHLAMDDALEDNDAPDAAVPVSSGQSWQGLIVFVGDEDYYAIEVCAGAVLSFDATFSHALGDIDLELQDGAGSGMAWASSVTDDEHLVWTSSLDGTVYLRVLHFGARYGLNGYALAVDLDIAGCSETCDDGGDNDLDGLVDCFDPDCVGDPACPCGADAYEPDHEPALATQLEPGAAMAQNHSICPVTDEDWYGIQLGGLSDLTIETSGPVGDTRLWLYDASLNEIDFDDDGGDVLFSRIARIDQAPGTYYALVDEFGDNGQIESYDIQLTAVRKCQAVAVIACGEALGGSNRGQASNIDRYNCSGWDESGPEMVYHFEVPADQHVSMSLSNMSADLDIFLLEPGCAEDACQTYGGVSLAFDAVAGTTYFVSVDGYYGAESDFTLSVACTPL
ncbi:MAG: PPC domain-containing protein [Deltaproteobacteria bacterium]|nr:PPC domain-containing protein [Deltaproteobacteria bacterium]